MKTIVLGPPGTGKTHTLLNQVEDYHSHNTDRLGVAGMKKLLLKLSFIKEDINQSV